MAAIRRGFLKYQFPSGAETIENARTALNQASSSLISTLPTDLADDEESLKRIINLTDRFLLSKNDNGMYEKVIAAANSVANSDDERLFEYLNNRRIKHSAEDSYGSACRDAFFKAFTAVTAMDKLNYLAQALRLCASLELPTPNHQRPIDTPVSARIISDDISNNIKTSPGGSSVAEKSIEKLMADISSPDKSQSTPSAHGADILIERVIVVICSLTKIYKLRWHAQCVFIEQMCPDTSWLLGAEGYSLVTLQQVLNSIVPSESASILNRSSSSSIHDVTREAGSSSAHTHDDHLEPVRDSLEDFDDNTE
jgi:hypothetical protein